MFILSGALNQIHGVEQTLGFTSFQQNATYKRNIGMLPGAKYQIPLSSTSTVVAPDS